MIEWLTTLPGILVCIGVFLLLLSLIMFIIGNKKEKKDEIGDTIVMDPIVGDDNNFVPMQPTNVNSLDNNSINNVYNNISNNTSNNINNQPMFSVGNENMFDSNNMMNNVEQNVNSFDNFNNVNQQNIIGNNLDNYNNENVFNGQNVNDMSNSNNYNSIDIQPAIATNNDSNFVNPMFSGNVNTNPFFDEVQIENINVPEQNASRPIYGGADPLDATREMPKINVSRIPYSGGVERPNNEVISAPDDVESL